MGQGQAGFDEDDAGDNGHSVRAVVRAVEILNCFDGSSGPMTVAEIRRQVKLSRPTLYRLLNTLVETGLLQVEGEPQRFRLGRGAARLGRAWAGSLDVEALARPILDALRDRTGETAALIMLRSDRFYCVAESSSRHALSMSRGVGELEDSLRGASGLAVLAWLDRERVGALIAASKDAMDLPALLSRIEEVRSAGYAVSHGAVFVGALSIAAPVFDNGGDVAGSLCLFGPEARMAQDDVSATIGEVRASAARLSEEMGAPAAPR